MIIVNDNRGVHLVYPEEKETYKSLGYSIYEPNTFPDCSDLEFEVEQDLKNRGAI